MKKNYNRDAVSTNRGFCYQFDKQILEILNSKKNQKIQIEGVEDVDIFEDEQIIATQCKYHEMSNYSISVIKEPIKKMIEEFLKHKKTGKRVKFHLYAHFKDSPVIESKKINFEILKNQVLTTKSKTGTKKIYKEIKATDKDLRSFLKVYTSNIQAKSFDDQNMEVISLLSHELNCSKEEILWFHYPVALGVIRKMAINRIKSERVISKESFKKEISLPQKLFQSWYFRMRDKNDYLRFIKNKFFKNQLNIINENKLFIIDCRVENNNLKSIVRLIAHKFGKISDREIKPFSPFFYFLGLSEKDLSKFKNDLKKEGLLCSDGYDFFGAEFDVKSLERKPTPQNELKLRIINSNEDLVTSFSSLKFNSFFFCIKDWIDDFKDLEIERIKIEEIEDIKGILIG